MNNEDYAVEKRDEDYNYNIAGHCPRCNGKLLPARLFYLEPSYKKAARCFACSRVWEWNKKAEEPVIVQ